MIEPFAAVSNASCSKVVSTTSVAGNYDTIPATWFRHPSRDGQLYGPKPFCGQGHNLFHAADEHVNRNVGVLVLQEEEAAVAWVQARINSNRERHQLISLLSSMYKALSTINRNR